MIIEARTPDDWRDLQDAVARILDEAGFDVEVEKEVDLARGQVTVDVYARDAEREPPATYLIECKHWQSAVPQTVVHAFRTVVADQGANGGFIISSAGFQRGAYEAAEKSNIELLTWEQFQELFVERWYQGYAVPILREELDPLVEYTEPINSRIFRKADALPEKQRQQFIRLRERYRDLGMAFVVAWFPLPGGSKPVSAPLPLVEVFADRREELDIRLPDDLLEARALREFMELLVQHARAALHEFDAVFGERA